MNLPLEKPPKNLIINYSFKTLPDEKEKIISRLQSENKNVAMIGDGINDVLLLRKQMLELLSALVRKSRLILQM